MGSASSRVRSAARGAPGAMRLTSISASNATAECLGLNAEKRADDARM